MGAILNSKSEFNRSYIPRLRVVDDEEISEMEKQEEQKALEVEEGIRKNENQWEEKKSNTKKTGEFRKSKSRKHGRQVSKEDGGERIPKRRQFSLVENWGEPEGVIRI